MALLARALRVDRAALVLAAPEGGRVTPVAVHGDVSDQEWTQDAIGTADWSDVLPLGEGPRRGFLLLGRPGDGPLSEQDRALVQSALGTNPFEAFADSAAARDRLAHADRLAAIGTLAAGVAHEIRNPLVSVRTFIQLLPERLDDEEFRTSFRELALGEIDRICELINDLLAFSRPAVAERESTDVAEIARQTTRLLDAEARKRDVRLTCATAAGTPRVRANEAQLKQVLLNVVLNGIQACPGAGRVMVSTRGEQHAGRRWAVIEVADTGPGVCDADVARIFDPFFTTKPLGSGLGLFIARRIVDDHGGTIQIRRGLEGGSVFVIRLPAEDGDGDTA
ncbi:MAG TPA: ATP-binding protein [Candidatus Limnocylindria bacterium]|nr:ATP-binding protein [Candidatus Limnocylindria bacterium]